MEEKIVIEIPIKQILDSPVLNARIMELVEQYTKVNSMPEYLTRAQMAQMYQVSQQTIDRLTDEELEDRGFRRIKIGVSVRFEKITS
jgi:hypothetical protein